MTVPTFHNVFTSSLPGDPLRDHQSRQVLNAAYSFATPKKVSQPKLIALSESIANQLGFLPSEIKSAACVNAFVGNSTLDGMEPYAMCYGGHQFGNWAGQLGDGRAINLGEIKDALGNWQTVQLKGAGPTPYSRRADGLAVLRSSIREFLCSEAMYHLGVPTTRALSLIATGESVERDMFYDGHPKLEPGAVVSRVAPSFIRFGNFEIFAARDDIQTLEKITAFTLENYYPHYWSAFQKNPANTIVEWLAEVSERTCDMIVDWMRLGFVHGVMNTDNMSIHGITIDYGPYGWLDNFDPTWTPNTTDAQGRRYRYEHQPAIAQWNILQLANALYPLVKEVEGLEHVVKNFAPMYESKWRLMMLRKLGLYQLPSDEFLSNLETLLYETQMDMTLFYRSLFDTSSLEDDELNHVLNELSYLDQISEDHINRWQQWFYDFRLQIASEKQDPAERREHMLHVNPHFILRNYVAQMAIDKAYDGDYSLVKQCLTAAEHPYEEHVSQKGLVSKRPNWAENKAGCSMLSCSS